MSNYSKTTDFEAKDSLPTGDSGKIIRGAEFETEFDAISTAIATKADTAGPTFTGTLTFETISDGTIGVTAFVDEDDMSSDSATLVPTQQSVKAYVDSQVTAQDLDFQADTGGALSIDLDSETLTFTGGTGIDTSGSGNAVTFAIDSTVATLTGAQTLTNKTLTSPVLNTGVSGTAVLDEDNMASNSATQLATQQSIKAYVDSQVGANNELSEILANGNTTGGTNIVFGDSASVSDDRLVFGAGSDLQIYHSGTHSYIDDAGTGNLTLRGNASVRVEKYEGEVLADFAADGAVSLYHDNSVKIATTSSGVSVTGNVAVSGTVDGRDVATDGTKLDGIESGATADQTAAEIRTLVESATDSNVFTDADHTKLDGIEASADVTDTANVTAAGAVMDSELTNETAVKALNQGVATTDSPTFAGVTVNGNVEFDGLSGTGSVTVTDILDQDDMSGNSATALATQQSIKAYVDSQVATVDTLAEVLGNGNTTGGTDIAVGTGDDITFADSSKAIFGAGSDLQIYHDGTHSYVDDSSGTGRLILKTDYLEVQNAAGNEAILGGIQDGAVSLFYDGNTKLATTSTGIDVTGQIVADTADFQGQVQFNGTAGIQLDNGAQVHTWVLDDNFTSHFNIGTSSAAAAWIFGSNNANYWTVSPSGVIVNQDSGDTDFRVESNNNANMLFVDAGNDAVAFGTNVTTAGTHTIRLDGTDIAGSTDGATVTSSAIVNLANFNGTTTDNTVMLLGSTSATTVGQIASGIGFTRENSTNWGTQLRFYIHPTATSDLDALDEVARFTTSEFVVNEQSMDYDFRVESDNNTHMLFVDAGNDRVGIGTSSPSGKLSISGATATNEQVHATFTNTQGAKTFAIGAGQSGVTNNGFVIRNVTDNTFPLVISDAGAATFSGAITANAGVVVDTITIDGSTVASTGSLGLDIGGNLTIDVDGTTITLADGGLNWGQMFNSSQNFYFKNPTSDKDILFQGIDGGVVLTALTLDMSNAGSAIFNASGTFNEVGGDHDFRVESNSNANMLFLDAGNERLHINGTTGTATFNVAGSSSFANTATSGALVASGATLSIQGTGTYNSNYFGTDRATVAIRSNEPSNDGWNPTINIATVRQSLGTNQNATGGIGFTTIDDSNNTGIDDAARIQVINTNGANNTSATGLVFYNNVGGSKTQASRAVFKLAPYEAIFNEDSHDIDFRVESNNNANMLFVDGGSDRVGIGRDPTDNDSTLQISADATSSTGLQLQCRGATNENKKLVLGYDTTSDIASITSFEAGVTHRPLHLQGSTFVWNEDGSDHDFRVESDSNTHMLFVDGGNNAVCIGTATQEATLTVGENQASSFVGHFRNSNGSAYGLGIDTGSGSQIFFYLSGANKGSIVSNSSGTTYNTTSDARLKENIADADDAGELIDAIQVRQFDWIEDGEHQRYGMVAQELNTVAPEAVSQGNAEEDMMGVDYSKLVPMLVKEIQSLRARVAQLESN